MFFLSLSLPQPLPSSLFLLLLLVLPPCSSPPLFLYSSEMGTPPSWECKPGSCGAESLPSPQPLLTSPVTSTSSSHLSLCAAPESLGDRCPIALAPVISGHLKGRPASSFPGPNPPFRAQRQCPAPAREGSHRCVPPETLPGLCSSHCSTPAVLSLGAVIPSTHRAFSCLSSLTRAQSPGTSVH